MPILLRKRGKKEVIYTVFSFNLFAYIQLLKASHFFRYNYTLTNFQQNAESKWTIFFHFTINGTDNTYKT